MRGTLLSLQGKSVDWQPWQPGDLRKGRLDPYKVARPPGVRVALLLNGSVIITANCGNGDVRPCDSIREAAELAARLNQAVRDQIVADERLKELMRESLDVIGETDARLDAADKAAAATNAAAVATVRRAEDANGHGGRKIFRNALALVQRSCDVASSQFSVAGLDFQAALPAADKTQGALLLGSHVHAPPPLRRKVHNIYERVAEEHGWKGVAPFLEELNKAANAEDLLVDVFGTMGLDIRPHRELVQKWYAIGSMTMGSVLESSLVVAPKTVLYYGLREPNVYTAFAAEYASLAALDQRHAFERYSKFRALYEKAKKEGRLDFLAEDVVDLLAGACSPAYYEYVAAEEAKKIAAEKAKKKDDNTAADADGDVAMA